MLARLQHWQRQGPAGAMLVVCMLVVCMLIVCMLTCTPACAHVMLLYTPQVITRLALSDKQLLHLRLASEEFARLSQEASDVAGELVLRAAVPSLYVAAAEAQGRASGGSEVPGSDGGTGRGGDSGCVALRTDSTSSVGSDSAANNAAAPADTTADATAGQEDLQDDLQRHVRHRLLHMLMMGMFAFNTLSRVQIARMTVSVRVGCSSTAHGMPTLMLTAACLLASACAARSTPFLSIQI